MRKESVIIIIPLLAIALACVGCNSPLSDASGHYEGFLLRKRAGHVSQLVATSEVKKVSDSRVDLDIAAGTGNTFQFTVKVLGDKALELTSKAMSPGTVKITRPKGDEDCFSANTGSRDAANLVMFCYTGNEISIDLGATTEAESFSLVLDRGKLAKPPVYETAQKYTLTKLMQQAYSKNFDSQIEFEHVVQAKLAAKTAWLNLLPHLTINSIIAVVSMDAAAILGSIGDLVPFLLPTRWFQAEEAKLRAVAERDAYTVMRADTMNIIEGLAYSVQRDTRTYQLFAENLKKARVIRDEILARERLGQFLPGTSDDMTSVVNGLEQALVGLDAGLHGEKTALAQAAGFVNPEAISELDPITDIDVEKPEPVDLEGIKTLTFQRSIELRQMDALIDVSRWLKYERYMTWLDPVGDYQGGIGLNLLSYVPIGSSQIRELQLKKDQLGQTLAQKISSILSDRETALRQYHLAVEGLSVQNRRVNRFLQQMRLGQSFDLVGLVAALQDLVQTGVTKVSSEHAYYVAVSKINRLIFAGPYSGIEFDRAPGRSGSGGVVIHASTSNP